MHESSDGFCPVVNRLLRREPKIVVTRLREVTSGGVTPFQMRTFVVPHEQASAR